MNQTTVAPQTNGSPERSLQSLLERIDGRLARLEAQAAKVEILAGTAPAFVATVTDTVDSLTARLAADGVDVDQRVRVVLRLLERLTAPRLATTLEALLDSELLGEPARLTVIGLNDALKTSAASAPPVGFWGVMRALGDPDIQRALGLLFGLMKQLGRSLASSQAPQQLPKNASGV